MLRKGEFMQDEVTQKNVTTAVPVLQSASIGSRPPKVDLGISPGQQLIASGTGAVITTLLVMCSTHMCEDKRTGFTCTVPLPGFTYARSLDLGLKKGVRTVRGHNALLFSILTGDACTVTPLDVVKIRLQAQVKPIGTGQCFVYCNGLMDHLCTCLNGGVQPSKQWYNKGGHFNGVLDAFVKISRTEGLPKLWSGLSPTLVMAVPATVLYYTAYDQLKAFMGYRYETSNSLVPVVAGGLARVFAVSVISPLELVRTKMQSRPLTFVEILGCFRTAVQDGGLLSLWRGWGPTILRDVPFSCILWFNFEILRARLMQLQNVQETTFSVSFISGAIAGGIAAFFTNPFDVVKTHRQIEIGEIDVTKDKSMKKPPTSTWFIMRRIHARSGINGLYAGFVPRLGRIAPACAIMIGSYEYGKAFFRHYNEQHQHQR